MIASYSIKDLQGCKTYDDNPTFKTNKTAETGNATMQGLTKLLLCKIKQVFTAIKQQNIISKPNKFNKKRGMLNYEGF